MNIISFCIVITLPAIFSMSFPANDNWVKNSFRERREVEPIRSYIKSRFNDLKTVIADKLKEYGLFFVTKFDSLFENIINKIKSI